MLLSYHICHLSSGTITSGTRHLLLLSPPDLRLLDERKPNLFVVSLLLVDSAILRGRPDARRLGRIDSDLPFSFSTLLARSNSLTGGSCTVFVSMNA